jgi:hypothetical protein
MSFYFPNVDPAYIYKRKGDTSDPYLFLHETARVTNGNVILKEIPKFEEKVITKKLDGTTLTETTSGILLANQYRVDYSTGVVFLHESLENANLQFDYYGTGYVSFPASRVWIDTGVNTSGKNMQRIINDLDNNINNWLMAVNTFSDISTNYPTPKLGDTVQTVSDSKIYRFDGDIWINTQQYSANALTNIQNKVGDTTSLLTESKDTLVNSLNENVNKIGLLNKKTSSFISIKEYNVVADGITDDTVKIQNAIDYANANNLILIFDQKEYLISQLNFKKANYLFNGATFKMKNSLTGNIYALDFQTGVIADSFNLNIPSGITAERFIRIQSDCVIEKVKVVSVSQQTILNDNLDGAVNVTGSNHRIGRIDVKNCDYAVVVYNTLSSYIGQVKVESFVRGLYVRQSKDVQFQTVSTSVKSPNGTQNAGHNGILVEECEELRFPNVYINDAGEQMEVYIFKNGLVLEMSSQGELDNVDLKPTQGQGI